MSIRKLNAENAIIKTASVEVKTLTISGKQVTLAVFRQLPERPLIDADNLLINGIPWGTVNYHPDKCADNDSHIHVVWQKGSTLCRSYLRKNIYEPAARTRLDVAKMLYAARLYIIEDGEGWDGLGQKKITVRDADYPEMNWPVTLQVRKISTDNYSSRNAAKRICGHYKLEESQQYYLARLAAALRNLDEWTNCYDDLYAQMEELDQLYIAV